MKKLFSAFLLSFCMICNLLVFDAQAATSKVSKEDVHKAGQKTINFYHTTYKPKEFKGLLDWPALGLYGFGEDLSGEKWAANGKNAAYFRAEEVKKGIMLSKTKNTDFQRTIIGVCSAGKDPRNFGGVNLVEIEKGTMLPSGHFADSVEDNKTKKPVGEDLVNAHIFGIIALYCAGEEIPNKEKCLKWLEDKQNKDGGYTWDVKYFDNPKDYDLVESDCDMTSAALMAFSILKQDTTNPHVKKALDYLHKKQLDNGGFTSWGSENSESCAWAIQAIRMLNQDPMGSEWTKANGENPVSALLRFQLADGSFAHSLAGGENTTNLMATEQALYGLADAYNEKAVYTMLHEKYKNAATNTAVATTTNTANENKTGIFTDFKEGDFGYKETVDLVNNKVLSGYPDNTFKPSKEVTRAEFSKFLVYGLKVENEIKDAKASSLFTDINENHWANGCIGLCVQKGYVKGTSQNTYSPNDNITGEQLMVMLVRAGGLEEEAKKIESQNNDWSYGYIEVAKKKGLVYEGFEPKKGASRAQCAWSISKLIAK